jgi:carbohydrate-binding DOMON domain-containing protein
MSTQYRLVQSGKTASGGCSAGQGSSEPVAPRIYLFIYFTFASKARTEATYQLRIMNEISYIQLKSVRVQYFQIILCHSDVLQETKAEYLPTSCII